MIQLDHVTVEVDERRILDDISFRVKNCETKVLLGPSGAGKSSILKIILGLWKPNTGSVVIDNVDITRLSEREQMPVRRRMSMVFQANALFDSLTVAENVGFFLREHSDMSPRQIDERVRECLDFVNMPDDGDLLPEEISGGMKKRVAIARAIAFHPEVVLYDEPTTGLDPLNAKTITELILKLKHERCVTSIVVTHILRDAFAVGDTLAVLHDGKIVLDGTGDELLASNNPFVLDFLSEIREEADLLFHRLKAS
jgi:phospholipid/cholesterol/gamma-HCH transport system ATP-binding protein